MKITNFTITLTNFLIVIIALNFSNGLFSQRLYAGIEIGSKSIKTSVIKIKSIEDQTFEMVNYWSTDTALAKNLALSENLDLEKIDLSVEAVKNHVDRLENEFKVGFGDIYIVTSASLNKAKNLEVLTDKVIEVVSKKVNALSLKTESLLLLRGCVEEKNYTKALVLDIGASYIKGGYIEEIKTDKIEFSSINLDLGTVTLNELLERKVGFKKDLATYNDEIFKYVPTIDKQFSGMYNEKELARSKKNVYLLGGAPWAFCVLSEKKIDFNTYNEITFKEVQEYDAFLKNNFNKFQALAENDKEVEKVLKTYNQRQLIAANTLVLAALENIGDHENKKFYYTKNGQVAWIISYVLDSAKKIKIPEKD